MRINVAQTTAPASSIAAELADKFEDPAAVIYFASSATDFAGVAKAVADAFPSAATFGCTTAGELISGAMSKGTVVAMGMGRETIARALVAVVDGVAGSDAGIKAAIAGFERELGTKMLDLDLDRWIGLVLVDGLSGAEERLMDELGNLTDVAFVGGSAGDDLAFKTTLVAANGVVHQDAAVLVLLECPNGFELLKTQSFVATGKSLVPTSVDRATRTVLEFDGRPAAEAYAEAVGVPVDRLAEQFMVNPLGLMAAGEPYVRSPQQLVGSAVKFYCAVDEGMPLAVLESDDIVAQTRADLAAATARAGAPAGIINFNCILRTLELEAEGQCDAYGKLFEGTPTVGFSTYGEEYIGHINQTATMLLLR
jgi:hypothetical protein